jgi:2-amino-4-hydroxy-6-hydroxymethyldihydropteridine diphosphokinase
VILLLGCNVGDRRERLREGLDRLSRKVEVERISRVFAAEPWGYADQPWFLNQAARGKCDLPPRDLLAFVKEVEVAAGRIPGPRWGPRELDVDIVLIGERIVQEPLLVVPHARLAFRRFCLAPVSEVAPAAIVPPGGQTIRDLLEACGDPLEVFPI